MINISCLNENMNDKLAFTIDDEETCTRAVEKFVKALVYETYGNASIYRALIECADEILESVKSDYKAITTNVNSY